MTPYINIHTHFCWGDALSIHTVGIHPYMAAAERVPLLRDEQITPSIEAIGEVGLDFSRDIDRLAQEKLFIDQLELAQRYNLPVVIHCVRAFERVMNILSSYSLRAVIFHGFIGSKEQARLAVNRGYYLSFGHRTFSSPKTVEALKEIPLYNMFFETDESRVPIEDIYALAVECREGSMEDIKEKIYNNFTRIFR